MQNTSKIFPDLKGFGFCLTIWKIERGDLLCLENVAFVSPFFIHHFYNVSENAMIRNSNKTRSMLSPCFTPTLNGMEVSKFPTISLTTLFHTLF